MKYRIYEYRTINEQDYQSCKIKFNREKTRGENLKDEKEFEFLNRRSQEEGMIGIFLFIF